MATEWLSAFENAHSRPLRVLHIGNIANNAYNNAKIQRQHGIEADVVCYGCYHIMGTPEWEDAEIKGDVDADNPDWWSVDLGDWQRPEWFVQGPVNASIDYCNALRSGNAGLLARARFTLETLHWDLLEAEARMQGRRRNTVRGLLPLAYATKDATTSRTWSHLPRAVFASVRTACIRMFNGDSLAVRNREFLVRAIAPRLKIESAAGNQGAIDRTLVALYRVWAQRNGTPPTAHWNELAARTPAVEKAHLSSPRSIAMLVSLLILYCVEGGGRAVSNLIVRLWRGTTGLPAMRPDRDSLEALHRARFPNATEPDRRRDIELANELAARWGPLLVHYDIVQGYSTDAIIPLMHSVKAFAAYEHGTLREIPFEDTPQGRLCQITYAEAPRVFITNSDVLPSVTRIGIPQERVVYLPHAFNDAKLRAFRDANPQLRPPDGPPVFFSPTRHHWQDGNGSWLKGNDVFLRAAGELAKEGFDFRLKLVEWGAEVEKSKALIAELGIAHLVTWVSTMSKRQLWQAYCEAHAVIDQFTLPAIGGVAFETLALGCRLLSRIDEGTLATFFGRAPPILNGATVDQVAEQMRQVIADRNDARGIGASGRDWIETYHSADRVVALQIGAYAAMLTSSDLGQVKSRGG